MIPDRSRAEPLGRDVQGDDFPWWDSGFLCPDTVRHLRLGERAVLFCERSQQLFELNVTADYIWHGLTEGRSPRLVAGDLEVLGAPADDAFEYVRANILELLGAGRLLPDEVARLHQETADAQLHLRLCGLACTIRLYMPPFDPLARHLRDVFGQFFTERPPKARDISVVAQAGYYFLLVDGAPFGMFSPERIVPELKAMVTEQLSRSTGAGSFLLHAALLASNGRGLLISGSPGAGKTTLALALAARGMGYASDDIVEVSGGSHLHGVRFSPASKPGGWDLIRPYIPGVTHLPIHRRGDGQPVRYVPVSGFGSGEVERLGWALLLDRRPGARARLQPLEPLAMLTELLSGASCAEHHIRGDTLQAFTECLSTAKCLRLVYSDLASAVTAVEEMTGG